jgi:predicted metal-dependent enzyme (double-stranded beta helix superfamily)
MAYTLDQLSTEIRAALTADPGTGGRRRICEIVGKALLDKAFIDQHVTAEQCRPRKVLYEDPKLGFCICGHVYGEAKTGAPHDHGPTWAIYGLASGNTVMTDWKVVAKGQGDNPTLVKEERSYELRPGDAHYYEPGAVHSPRWTGPTRLLRIEGANLDKVQRSNIKAA